MNTDSHYSNESRKQSKAEPWMVAVIDIGATSLRMQVAEIHPGGKVHKLESFSQAVSLGKDSFISGRINKKTIEDCVHVLRIYRAKLDEYGITKRNRIRVIATSGLKEADNRLAFQDRVFIATGFEVEPFDEAELHRVTYLVMLPYMEAHPDCFAGKTLIMEIGGGTTELMMLEDRDVVFSQTYRLGSLRLRKTFEAYDAPPVESRSYMESTVKRTLQRHLDQSDSQAADQLIVMGGDIRFAAKELGGKLDSGRLFEVAVDELETFTEDILAQSPDALVSKYRMSLPEAQTLGPSLLATVMFAKEFGLPTIQVAGTNLRDGLVEEMTEDRRWIGAIQAQIRSSALQLGRKFHINEAHALQVASNAVSLFDQLGFLHQLGPRFRGLLEMAAVLHEVGLYISTRSNHKHALYLISNSSLFGVGKQDMQLIALIARYHRRALPQPSHEGFLQLTREDRLVVRKLASILRVAKALDCSRNQRIKEVECKLVSNEVVIATSDVAELSFEQLELRRRGQFFEDLFGTQLTLKTKNEY